MRLLKFRVKNFRSVVDSGWIDADRVTALIGVNESGKTNLLLPLWKLNPAREGEVRPTSDYPKGNYAAIRQNPQNFYFIQAHFDATEIAGKLSDLTGLDQNVTDTVCVFRNFAGDYWCDFPKYEKPIKVPASEVIAAIDKAISEILPMAPLAKEGSLREDFVAALEAAKNRVANSNEHDVESIAEIKEALCRLKPEAAAPTSSIVPRYALLLEALEAIEGRLKALDPNDVPGVKDLVVKKLPRFVFYSNYGNLDSEIYLPHVVQNLTRDDLGAKEAAKARTLRVLFSFVGLQPKEVLELGRDFKSPDGRRPSPQEIEDIATNERERTILLNSAGTDLTKKFRDWWKQGDYTFEFQADGDHFRIWVSDKRRPEKIELEDRSSGLQWFFSFYLIFLVESAGDHRDAILLLDEPGLSLHPLAQRDLSAFFENLTKTNQIIYTTHSPFLVEADMLDRVRKVYVADDGSTKASPDLRVGTDDPRKSGATYAIYSALNMNVAESILYGCQPVIVEGPSDQHYLSTIKLILIANKRINPKRELVFPPAHAAGNAKAVASILSGREEILPSILLDGDDAGQRMARDLRNGLYQSEKKKIRTTDSYVAFENSEVEDLFPVDFFVGVVDRWGRRAETAFSEIVKAGEPIVPQIEAWARTEGIALSDGWKVELARETKKRALASNAKFTAETIELWGKIFDDFLVDDDR